MKKVLIICLVLALTLTSVISTFAGVQHADVNFELCNEGDYINSPDISTNILTIRQDWTCARKADGSVRNLECKVVKDPLADDALVGKYVAPEYMYSEDDSSFEEGSCYTFTVRPEVTNGFSGVVFCQGSDKLKVETKESKKTDYYYTEYPAASGNEDACYALATGFGFTFLKTNNNKVRFFVRCFNDAGELDVIYYDVDLNTDATQQYVPISMYYTECYVMFAIDDKCACTIEYDNEDSVSEKVGGTETLSDDYYRNAKICNSDGKAVAKSDKALIGSNRHSVFAQTGEGTTLYLLQILYERDVDMPEEGFNGIVPYETNPNATPLPEEATPVPATEAPATEAPATEAPATEAPATEAPKANTGCGSVIASTSIAIIALSAFAIFKKKED